MFIGQTNFLQNQKFKHYREIYTDALKSNEGVEYVIIKKKKTLLLSRSIRNLWYSNSNEHLINLYRFYEYNQSLIKCNDIIKKNISTHFRLNSPTWTKMSGYSFVKALLKTKWRRFECQRSIESQNTPWKNQRVNRTKIHNVVNDFYQEIRFSGLTKERIILINQEDWPSSIQKFVTTRYIFYTSVQTLSGKEGSIGLITWWI